MNRLTSLLKIAHPIVQGPFGGGISRVGLVSAVSNSGGLGSFGAHILSPDEIRKVVEEIRAQTLAPFSINLWVPQPGEQDLVDLAPPH
jgi:nitronate monooxygenase